eukprot:g66429.t1
MGMVLLKQIGVEEWQIDADWASATWDLFDVHKTGRLSVEQTKEFLQRYAYEVGFVLTDHQIDGFFQLYDPDHLGSVSKTSLMTTPIYTGCKDYQQPSFGDLCAVCQKSKDRHMPKVKKQESKEAVVYFGCDRYVTPTVGYLCVNCQKHPKKHSPDARTPQTLSRTITEIKDGKVHHIVECPEYEAPSIGNKCKRCQKSMKVHSLEARAIHVTPPADANAQKRDSFARKQQRFSEAPEDKQRRKENKKRAAIGKLSSHVAEARQTKRRSPSKH